MTRQAWIVATARSAIGTAYRGSLIDVDPVELGTAVVGAAVERSGIDPACIDDVVLSESLAGGGVIARNAAIEAGMMHVPGLAQNRHCAGGLAALTTAAGSILAGMDRVVVAGGVQSSSLRPEMERRLPGTDEAEAWFPPSHPETPDAPVHDMSVTVGWNTAVQAGITREEMDVWAARSHARAVAGIDSGSFVEEIVPLEVARRDGSIARFAVDEHPRRDTTVDKLAGLTPLHPEIDGFSITAGNSSGINDGGAALVLVDSSFAEANGLTPLAVVEAWASVGVPPAKTGLAPTKSIPKALARAGLAIDDITLWEVNEAFASIGVATSRALGLDESLVNVLGSGCSLGHPVAMSGARMVISLTHELRRRGGGTGVAAMCAGGGMSTAVVIEVPAP